MFGRTPKGKILKRFGKDVIEGNCGVVCDKILGNYCTPNHEDDNTSDKCKKYIEKKNEKGEFGKFFENGWVDEIGKLDEKWMIEIQKKNPNFNADLLNYINKDPGFKNLGGGGKSKNRKSKKKSKKHKKKTQKRKH